MAIIRSISKGAAKVGPNKSMVDATVQIVESEEFGKLIHIATYGSESRRSEPKVSQVIQMDRKIATKLGKIIADTFGESSE